MNVKALINSSCGKTDEDFKDQYDPHQTMVSLTLLYTVMHCGINEVTFCETNGSAEGVLITPDLW